MWRALLFLWSIPLMLGFVALARIATGSAAISDQVFRLFFGKDKEIRLSLWMGIKFAVVAAIFFVAGLLQGAVLLNFDMLRIASAAFLTASAAGLFLLLWVRTAPAVKMRPQRGRGGSVNMLFRKLSSYRSRLKKAGVLVTSKRRKHRRDAAPVTHSYDDFEL